VLLGDPVCRRPTGHGQAAPRHLLPDAGAAADDGTIIGAIVLRQLPTGQDLLGIALVVFGVALHQVPADEGLHP
jgi:hypothetical protein